LLPCSESGQTSGAAFLITVKLRSAFIDQLF